MNYWIENNGNKNMEIIKVNEKDFISVNEEFSDYLYYLTKKEKDKYLIKWHSETIKLIKEFIKKKNERSISSIGH